MLYIGRHDLLWYTCATLHCLYSSQALNIITTVQMWCICDKQTVIVVAQMCVLLLLFSVSPCVTYMYKQMMIAIELMTKGDLTNYLRSIRAK